MVTGTGYYDRRGSGSGRSVGDGVVETGGRNGDRRMVRQYLSVEDELITIKEEVQELVRDGPLYHPTPGCPS